jgi:hypothetical protein
VDRGVDRRPRKSRGHVCIRSMSREASLLARRVVQPSALLLIRWFRVRPPGAPPAAPPAVLCLHRSIRDWLVDRPNPQLRSSRLGPSGHIEQLPSGSWRAKVYAGKDSLTGREIRFRKTRKTEVEAQIELGKLLELARSGRNPTPASPSPNCSTHTSSSPGGRFPRRKPTSVTSAAPSSPRSWPPSSRRQVVTRAA